MLDFSTSNFYIAQLTNAESNFKSNAALSQNIANSWDKYWTDFLSGDGLYQAINSTMLGLALIFLLITLASILLNEWNSGDGRAIAQKLVFPVIIVLMLSSKGAIGIYCIQGVRTIGNYINNTLIQKLEIQMTYVDKLDKITNEQTAMKIVQSRQAKCNAQSTLAAMKACNDELIVEIDKAKGAIKNPDILSRLDNYKNEIQSIDPAKDSIEIRKKSGNFLEDNIGQAVFSAVEGFLYSFLQVITYAVCQLVEIAMLLTALTVPMSLAAGLLPSGQNALIGVFTTFWSLITYKFYYIVIVGLSAQLSKNDNSSASALALAFITALLAPLLAGLLAVGGGMAFMKAAGSGVSAVGGAAGQVATGGATGAASGAGGVAGAAAARVAGKAAMKVANSRAGMAVRGAAGAALNGFRRR